MTSNRLWWGLTCLGCIAWMSLPPSCRVETVRASEPTGSTRFAETEPRDADFRTTTTCAAAESTGTLVGRIVYRPAADRPWKFSRYYVKPKTFELAEAVVALDSPALRKWPRAGEPRQLVVDQKEFRFFPETASITLGDRLKFTNSDPQVHNVRSQGIPHEMDVTLGPGGAAVETPKRAGRARQPIAIGCKLHGQMRAWIYVFEHPFHHTTTEAGTFRFEQVPAGEHTLDLVHPAGGLATSRTVRVTAGKETTLELVLSPDDLVRPQG